MGLERLEVESPSGDRGRLFPFVSDVESTALDDATGTLGLGLLLDLVRR